MYKKENHSLARINKKLVTHINQWLLLHQDIDPRIITMGIIKLETSPDLSITKIIIRHPNSPESLAKVLNKHQHPIHQYLFKTIDIRRVPKIQFKAQDKALRDVLNILDEIDSE